MLAAAGFPGPIYFANYMFNVVASACSPLEYGDDYVTRLVEWALFLTHKLKNKNVCLLPSQIIIIPPAGRGGDGCSLGVHCRVMSIVEEEQLVFWFGSSAKSAPPPQCAKR